MRIPNVGSCIVRLSRDLAVDCSQDLNRNESRCGVSTIQYCRFVGVEFQ